MLTAKLLVSTVLVIILTLLITISSQLSLAQGPVSINITETIAVTDSPEVLPPVSIDVTESITVTDSPEVLPPVSINVVESISVTDDPDITVTPGPCSQVATATATGTAELCTGSGTISNLTAVPESTLPAAGKPNLNFPHGFFSFDITGLSNGASVTVTITLPSTVPIGTQYWKYGPTPGDPTTHWYQLPMGDDDGDNMITITLVDNGLGDDDLTANGVIVDQGGPGSPPAEGEGCFIATAAYGTESAEGIDVLRAFRDEVLLHSSLGSQLVNFYYDVSPPVADFISENDGLRTLVRELLVDPVAWVVDAIGTLWRN